jgi:hypothetical protein
MRIQVLENPTRAERFVIRIFGLLLAHADTHDPAFFPSEIPVHGLDSYPWSPVGDIVV